CLKAELEGFTNTVCVIVSKLLPLDNILYYISFEGSGIGGGLGGGLGFVGLGLLDFSVFVSYIPLVICNYILVLKQVLMLLRNSYIISKDKALEVYIGINGL
ncbi:hypothetical protein K501DRAFT_269382, partial [Backusella circina FSU 941]